MKNICLRKRMSQQAHAYLTIITFESKQEHVRPSRLHAPSLQHIVKQTRNNSCEMEAQ